MNGNQCNFVGSRNRNQVNSQQNQDNSGNAGQTDPNAPQSTRKSLFHRRTKTTTNMAVSTESPPAATGSSINSQRASGQDQGKNAGQYGISLILHCGHLDPDKDSDIL